MEDNDSNKEKYHYYNLNKNINHGNIKNEDG